MDLLSGFTVTLFKSICHIVECEIDVRGYLC